MCDPITLLAVAATAASTGANYISNQQVQSARSDAYAAERIRQQSLDREAQAINDQSRDRYNEFENEQGQRSGDLADYYNTVQNQVVNPAGAPAETATNANAGSVVAQEFGKQAAATNAFNQSQAEAQGRVSSFADLFGDKMRLQGRDAASIGQIGKFKQGWASIFPMAMEAANEKGQGWKLAGDVLGGLGSIGLAYGLRAPAAAASAASGSIANTAGPSIAQMITSAPRLPTGPGVVQNIPGQSIFTLY
jgi:hypothetical protein